MSPRHLRWILGAFLRRHRRLSLILVLAVAALALTWKYTSALSVGDSVLGLISEVKYTEGLVGVPQTLNPLFVSTDTERDLSRLLFRGLTTTDVSGAIKPDLAESWEASSNGQSYLFHLKPGLMWQNGDPLTASDVAFTYELARNPASGSPYSETFKNLSVQVVGTDSILFRLSDSFSPFLSLTSIGILSRHLLEKISPPDLKLAKFNLAPVGSTNFRLKSLTAESAIFTNGSASYVFRFYSSSTDLGSALKLGEIRAAGFTDATDFKDWGNLQILSSPLYQRFVAVFYNLRGGPASEKGVRQGLSYAIDKDRLVNQTLRGAGEIAYSSILPVSWAKVDNLRHYDYKPDLAKGALDKAGWTGGPVRQKDGQSLDISLSFRENPAMRAAAEQVAKDWGAVGVRAILNPLSPEEFQTKVINKKDFQAAIFTQEVGVDPDQYVLWHTTAADSTNITGLKLPKLDKALEDGRHFQTQDGRQEKYADFQRFLLDEAPVTFLYYPKYSYVVSTKVQGIDLKPLGVPSDRFSDIENWVIGRVIF